MPISRRSIVLSLLLPALGQAQESDCQQQVVAERVLERLNALRAEPRVCEQQPLGPAGPLRWELRLEQAALAHAMELARGDQLSHSSPSASGGRSPRERLRANGYLALRVGENLAAGQDNLDEVLQVWSHSGKHCENIMQAEFQDVALACASGPGKYQRYWVLNLGRPLPD